VERARDVGVGEGRARQQRGVRRQAGESVHGRSASFDERRKWRVEGGNRRRRGWAEYIERGHGPWDPVENASGCRRVRVRVR
jgi:hypothetical protein